MHSSLSVSHSAARLSLLSSSPPQLATRLYESTSSQNLILLLRLGNKCVCVCMRTSTVGSPVRLSCQNGHNLPRVENQTYTHTQQAAISAKSYHFLETATTFGSLESSGNCTVFYTHNCNLLSARSSAVATCRP